MNVRNSKPVEQVVAAIEALDLEPIKFKLMDADEGPGWPREYVEKMAVSYKRFLTLLVTHPETPIAPSKDIDKFWHGHILDTMKYAEDCENIFGYFLHHFPYFGMRGEEDAAQLAKAGEAMSRLYEQEFGEPMSQAAAYCSAAAEAKSAYCSAAAKSAYCSAAAKPAYCSAATEAKPAYCSAAAKADSAAYCSAAIGAKPDLQSRPTLAKPAYCSAAVKPAAVKPAYCSASAKPAAVKPAYCSASAKPAYCSAATQAAYCSASTKAVSAAAYCSASNRPKPDLQSRPTLARAA